MEIQGKVIQAMPIQSGTSKSGNAWQKREFVIETVGQYPKKVCFTLFGDDKVAMCPAVGQAVKVSFDVDSREYNGKWYTTLNAWKVEQDNGSFAPIQPSPQMQSQPTMQPQQQMPPVAQGNDGLPF